MVGGERDLLGRFRALGDVCDLCHRTRRRLFQQDVLACRQAVGGYHSAGAGWCADRHCVEIGDGLQHVGIGGEGLRAWRSLRGAPVRDGDQIEVRRLFYRGCMLILGDLAKAYDADLVFCHESLPRLIVTLV